MKSDVYYDNGKEKRVVLPVVAKILDADIKLTNTFVEWTHNIMPLNSLKIHYKMLEVSCHGVVWLASVLALTWIFNMKSLYQMQVNLFFGLVVDIIFVAVLKAITRRRRPVGPSKTDIGPDKYSFPSGHASRACFVAYFFINLHTLPMYVWPPLLAWATSICLSRLLMEKHHILDVTCGILLGLFEGILIGFLWISEETSIDLLSFISDEKVEGADYHI